jgi:putative transposase
MSEYRRYFVPGGTFFFTVVTAGRAPIFQQPTACRLLGEVLHDTLARHRAKVIAMVLLPDHLHALWQLPPGDDLYDLRWSVVKRAFTRRWLSAGGVEQPLTLARRRERRRGVWQRRYWEHTIRDEADLEAHFDYIHYNPVKHGYVSRPRDWRWSTFHRHVRNRHYSPDWGAGLFLSPLPGDAGE